MAKEAFLHSLTSEVARIDAAHTAKRHEKIIEGFTKEGKALINGEPYAVFNSNDYLGLRLRPSVKAAEHDASEKYGAGPGAVRFISGTAAVYPELEKSLAAFHNRDAAILFSSAFSANVGAIHALIKGQSRDSLVSSESLVVSDELNHRSIIDSVRVASVPSEQKKIYKHMNYDDLKRVLEENQGKYKRGVVITDGVFSMLGEYADLGKIREITDSYADAYDEGVWLVVDDSHGVGAFGKSGRGTEEVSSGQADVLIGTLGKAFGADGGYVVSSSEVIDYLRESAATYIYSNPTSPGTAGAALASVNLMRGAEGQALLQQLNENIKRFKDQASSAGFTFAADSMHPIQPLLIGDAAKTEALRDALEKRHVLVTNINYPVVPPGKDEIRVQISAGHTPEMVDEFGTNLQEAGKEVGIL